MKSFIFAYLFYGLTAISIANNELQNNDFYDGLGRMSNGLISYGANLPVLKKKPSINPDLIEIRERIRNINEKILHLELAIDLEIEDYNFHKDVLEIDRELWINKVVLNSNINNSLENSWNESELMILEAKKKLESLQERIKLEGQWGDISLKYNPLKNIDPNLRYRFPF